MLAPALFYLVSVLPGGAAGLPTVAVFPLEAKTGVSKDTADLLTEKLVEEVRRTEGFSQVVSSKEVEALLSFERQKQALDCSDAGCIRELAGALGVDFLLVGTLGRLGSSGLVNLRLMNTKSALVASSLSHTICNPSDEAVLRAMRPSVRRLVAEAGLMVGDGPESARAFDKDCEETAPPPVGAAASDPKSTSKPLADSTGRPWFFTGGVVSAGVSAALLVGGVGLAGAAGVWGWALLNTQWVVSNVPTPGLQRDARYYALRAIPVGAGLVGGVLGVMAVVFLGAAAALTVTGAFSGM
jgi:TolB-like protein